jgi:hypothetical protein
MLRADERFAFVGWPGYKIEKPAVITVGENELGS